MSVLNLKSSQLLAEILLCMADFVTFLILRTSLLYPNTVFPYTTEILSV